jgi:hypothetical protein
MHDEIRSRGPRVGDLDSKILAIVDKLPFESSRSTAERLAVVQSTVLWHLHKSRELKSFHLRCVPHQLTDDLREARKDHPGVMLPFLHAAQRDGWHHPVTGDGSAFCFDTSPRRMWTLSRGNVVTKSRQQIQSIHLC